MTPLEDGRGILFASSGEVTGCEIIVRKRALLADEPTVRKLTFALVTLVDVTAFHVSIDEIREIALIDRHLARLAPLMAVAVVAPTDHDFGVGRLWEGVIDVPRWSTMIFRSLTDADAWLQATAGTQPMAPGFGK